MRKSKLGHFAGLPPTGCRISSRPWTRGSAACRRPSPGGFPCTWLAVSSWRCSIFKGFTHRSCLNTWWIVDLLTPAEVAKVLQFRRGFCRSYSLLFLRSWWVKGIFSLLELLHDLPRRWMVHIQLFCNFNTTFPLFWSLATAFLKLSHGCSVIKKNQL